MPSPYTGLIVRYDLGRPVRGLGVGWGTRPAAPPSSASSDRHGCATRRRMDSPSTRSIMQRSPRRGRPATQPCEGLWRDRAMPRARRSHAPGSGAIPLRACGPVTSRVTPRMPRGVPRSSTMTVECVSTSMVRPSLVSQRKALVDAPPRLQWRAAVAAAASRSSG